MILAATAVLVGGIGAGFDGSASASTGQPDLNRADRAAMQAQAPYLAFDERVRRLAAGFSSSPLAGVRLDVPHRQMFVYWAGQTPAALESLRADVSAHGVRMEIVRAAHSEQQVMNAANQLAAFAESTRTDVSADVRTDGSGLTVHSKGLWAAAKRPATATPAQARLLSAMSSIARRTGVHIEPADATPSPAPSARYNDSSPYWAGAITRTSAGSCTSGFSAYATGASTRFMLTAAHCSRFTDGVRVGNGLDYRMGVTDFIHELFDATPSYDLGVIRLDPGLSNLPGMYLNDTTGVVVRGMASGIPAGGTYCISGAVGTPNCNLRSGQQVLVCNNPAWNYRCVYFIYFTSTTGGDTSCKGDSGGPIYYWSGSGIIAAGIQAGGYFTSDADRCSADGLVSVVASAVTRHNISGLRVLTQ